MDSQTTTLKKRKTTPESSQKIPVSIRRSLPVFLTVPPSKTRISGQNSSVPGAYNFFSIIAGLKVTSVWPAI